MAGKCLKQKSSDYHLFASIMIILSSKKALHLHAWCQCCCCACYKATIHQLAYTFSYFCAVDVYSQGSKEIFRRMLRPRLLTYLGARKKFLHFLWSLVCHHDACHVSVCGSSSVGIIFLPCHFQRRCTSNWFDTGTALLHHHYHHHHCHYYIKLLSSYSSPLSLSL